MSMLPPETERLWHRLEHDPLLAGWYLIGGTALSLLIGHRQSEDLDLAWPGGGKLPSLIVSQLTAKLTTDAWNAAPPRRRSALGVRVHRSGRVPARQNGASRPTPSATDGTAILEPHS